MSMLNKRDENLFQVTRYLDCVEAMIYTTKLTPKIEEALHQTTNWASIEKDLIESFSYDNDKE